LVHRRACGLVDDLEGRAFGARECAGDGEGGWVVGWEKFGDLVGVEPGDDGTVGVVHGVVPAVVGRHFGLVFLVRRVVDDFFPVDGCEETEGEAAVGLAEQEFEQIAGEVDAVACEGNLVVVFGLAMLGGEPGGDVFAREIACGFRGRGCGRRGREGEGARGSRGSCAGKALLLVVGLEDDFEALEIFGNVASGGFINGFVAAGALFFGDGGLRLLEMADRFAGDEVEAVVLELEVEFGRGVQSSRFQVQS